MSMTLTRSQSEHGKLEVARGLGFHLQLFHYSRLWMGMHFLSFAVHASIQIRGQHHVKESDQKK